VISSHLLHPTLSKIWGYKIDAEIQNMKVNHFNSLMLLDQWIGLPEGLGSQVAKVYSIYIANMQDKILIILFAKEKEGSVAWII
jgi:hypothetical protein